MRENSWNIVSESIRREYGFSDRIHRRSFTTNCLGSLYIVQHMQWTHRLNESRNIFYCMNFSNDRNLLCTGNENLYIDIYDWQSKKIKFSFKTKHQKRLRSVKFLSTGGNGMDLISSDICGQVRHTCIPPSGHYVSNRIFVNRNKSFRLITIPGSPLGFLAAGSSGGIYNIDLRAENWSSKPKSIIMKEEAHPFYLLDIAHHPFAPEICVCGYDKFVRVMDKRNLKVPIKKLYPSNLTNVDMAYATHCSYNYDGSEILAHYHKEEAYLFDNHCYKAGEFIQCYGDIEPDAFTFFGSTSEYMINFDGEKIEFRDKKTGIINRTAFRDFVEFKHSAFIELHSHLPVVATSCMIRDLDIWNLNVLKS